MGRDVGYATGLKHELKKREGSTRLDVSSCS
jgi:hypothetical protein